MSDKMECPVCGSYSSTILSAVLDGEPCPVCGTTAATVLEVDRLREQRGDAEIKGRLVELLVELGKVTAERDRLARIVETVRRAMDLRD